MNKTLKLSLVFVVATAAVVALFYVIPNIDPDEPDDKPVTSYLSELNDYVVKTWEQKVGWDLKTYNSLKDSIKTANQMSKISSKDAEELRHNNNVNATESIKRSFDKEMKRPNTSLRKVQTDYKGVQTLSTYKNTNTGEAFKNHPTIKELVTMYNAYESVLSFSANSFMKDPYVDDSYGWRNYATYKQEWDVEKNNLEKVKYFSSHFSKINAVNTAWREYPQRVDKAKQAYYDSLAKILLAKVESDANDMLSASNQCLGMPLESYSDTLNAIREAGEMKERLDAFNKRCADTQKRYKDETGADQSLVQFSLVTASRDLGSFVNRLNSGLKNVER